MSQLEATITDGAIEKITNLIAAKLRDIHLPSAQVQGAIDSQGDEIAQEFVDMFRAHVEANCDMIVRRVKVNRARTPKEALDATHWMESSIDDDVAATMPKYGEEVVDVYFFRVPHHNISEEEIKEAYAFRGLIPDPFAQAAVNEADPDFDDEHLNATFWEDPSGNWCYLTFNNYIGRRHVNVYSSSYRSRGLDANWWLAGVPAPKA
jgi:hypothetical protein